MGQRKIVGGVRGSGLNWYNIFMNMLDQAQKRHGIVHISGGHSLAHDDAKVAVHRLMGEVMRPLRLSRALHVPGLRVRAADALVGAAVVPLELLCPLFAALSGSPLKLLQPFLLVIVQPFPVDAGRFGDLNQLLRGAGGVGLDVGRIRADHTPADKALFNALANNLFEQPPEHLPEGRFPAAQLRDGAVIRHPVKEVEAQIPAQGDVGLDAPLDLPLRRDAVQKTHQQVLHDNHRVDGRAAIFFAVKRGCFLVHERQIQRRLQLSQEVLPGHQVLDRYHVHRQLHPITSGRFPHYSIPRELVRDFVNSARMTRMDKLESS